MVKILNYGSINIDRVYTVKNFVKSGETVSSLDYKIYPGGKGLNQSIAAAKAGARVYHAGCIGADGRFLLALLEKNGICTDRIVKREVATGHAVIQVDETGQNCILLHEGSNLDIPVEQQKEMLEGFDEGDVLTLQNEVNGNQEMIWKAAEKKMKIALNPSPYNERINELDLRKITWLFINEVEGEAMTGRTDPDLICDRLISGYPELAVILTLGKEGILYRDKNVRIVHGAYNVSVLDTTAGGDTFTGYFLSCLSTGRKLQEAIQLSTMASALTVSIRGESSSIPCMEEVAQFRRSNGHWV